MDFFTCWASSLAHPENRHNSHKTVHLRQHLQRHNPSVNGVRRLSTHLAMQRPVRWTTNRRSAVAAAAAGSPVATASTGARCVSKQRGLAVLLDRAAFVGSTALRRQRRWRPSSVPLAARWRWPRCCARPPVQSQQQRAATWVQSRWPPQPALPTLQSQRW